MNILDKNIFIRKLRQDKKEKDAKILVILVVSFVIIFFLTFFLFLAFREIEILNKIFKIAIALIAIPIFFDQMVFLYHSRFKISLKKLSMYLFIFFMGAVWFSNSIGKLIEGDVFSKVFKHPIISGSAIIFLFMFFLSLLVKKVRDKKDYKEFKQKKF
jgi:hypothetical protein